MKKHLLIILLFSSKKLFGQTIPTFQTPKPADLGTFGNYNQSVMQRNNGFPQNQSQQIREQNQRLTQAISNKELPPDVLADIWEMENEEKQRVSYHLPSYKLANAQTQAYYTAFEKIAEMLNGKKSLDLKRAVFLVENAISTMPCLGKNTSKLSRTKQICAYKP